MIHTASMDLGDGKSLSIETGKLAQQTNGSVTLRIGDTMVFASAGASGTRRPGIDFFPLLVDYEEKLYAVGRIPGGFFKREGRPTETAILTSRKIDRTLRPLFPKGYYNDVQLVVTPFSVDIDNTPDVLAINAASAALAVSDIPFAGPIGAVRIGKVNGKLVLDPSIEQMQTSTMDLVIAGTAEAISMIECGSQEVSEEEVAESIKLGLERIKKLIALQNDLAKKVGKEKFVPDLVTANKDLEKFVYSKIENEVKKALEINDSDKRSAAIDKIKADLDKALLADESMAKLAKECPFDVKNTFEYIQKKCVRKMMIDNNKRVGGRKLDEIRPLSCEVGLIPRAHGSALFARGDTQVLTIATLGALGEVQKLDGISPEETKRYMHHYNFPAYSVGEVRPLRGPGRREVGHGALAEKALAPVIPNEDDLPYTIRLVSEVMGSNGSTSMASTCGSTLALMDAGIKIKSPVAGISVGLVKEGDKEMLMLDIMGIEDYYGDMDFKVTGTKQGITAIQVDCKVTGLSYETIVKALAMAKVGRMQILEVMLAAIANPRAEMSQYAPRVSTIMINPSKIGLVIGPGGKMIKSIIEETGAQIDIEDTGRVLITAADADAAAAAVKMIEALTYEPKVGEVFKGRVVRIMPFGAFVEIAPGKDGLVHISAISNQRVNKVEDVLSLGQEVEVKLMEVDDQGRLNLSMKAVNH